MFGNRYCMFPFHTSFDTSNFVLFFCVTTFKRRLTWIRNDLDTHKKLSVHSRAIEFSLTALI